MPDLLFNFITAVMVLLGAFLVYISALSVVDEIKRKREKVVDFNPNQHLRFHGRLFKFKGGAFAIGEPGTLTFVTLEEDLEEVRNG